MTEREIGKIFHFEGLLRGEESAGNIHETPNGWMRGKHPEGINLMQAWRERQARNSGQKGGGGE
ncbi:hypothetical protein [Polaromonas sp.]|uniref:hypothetical protein n=1 Tax=Polaromonas sp. TaxID=1869339 RepID=UPI0025DE4825|nr:hypothetical protein [Polaromonas sp.]